MGGPDWKDHVDASLTRRMTGVGFVHPDPAWMAARWSSLLGLPALAVDNDGFDMATSDGGSIRFRKAPEGVEPHMTELDFEMTDKAESLRRANARGLETDNNGFTLMQVRCN